VKLSSPDRAFHLPQDTSPGTIVFIRANIAAAADKRVGVTYKFLRSQDVFGSQPGYKLGDRNVDRARCRTRSIPAL